MSASITIHPKAREALRAAEWAWDMFDQGYNISFCLKGDKENVTVTAWPETVRSNATRQKMVRYKNQFHGQQPDGAA